jgi:hypothetical protein
MTAIPRRGAIAAGIAAALAAVAAVVLIASSGSGRADAGTGGPARHGAGVGPARNDARATARREAGTAVGTPSARASEARYGGIPSWLPRAKVPVGRVVTATPARHRLAIEGDTVAVHLPSGRVMMTAVGPDVPKEGKLPVPATSPCRFLVTFAAVHGSIPIASQAFSFLGEHGQVHEARLSVRGATRVPRRIVAGHPVTLILSAVLPTGNGQLRWAPLEGKPVVSWDFDVEID